MMCSIEGCEREVVARGWCSMHYGRWYRHGDPLNPGTHIYPRVVAYLHAAQERT